MTLATFVPQPPHPFAVLASDLRFTNMGQPGTIWVISAIHSDADRLIAAHDHLYNRISPGDRILYTGNMTGYGPSPIETLDELLIFRRGILALPGMMPGDFIYLRGGQEEMWEKLQQIQFARNPHQVLDWMFSNGVAETLEAYGMQPQDALRAAGEGVMAMTKWTAHLRRSICRYPGHDIFQCQLKRAAYTSLELDSPALFVHAGTDPSKPLQDQGDTLWWGGRMFDHIETPCFPFCRVIRGFDPEHGGLRASGSGYAVTLDSGCGFGGSLTCAGLNSAGEVLEISGF